MFTHWGWVDFSDILVYGNPPALFPVKSSEFGFWALRCWALSSLSTTLYLLYPSSFSFDDILFLKSINLSNSGASCWYHICSIVRQAAKIPDIKIVNYQWLLKSIEGQKKEDERKYQVDQSGDSDAPRNDTADENKARSPTPIEAEIQAEEKKDKQTANGKKRARSPTPVKPETPNKDEEEEKPPEKRQRNRKTGKGKKRARSPTPVNAESQVKYEEEDEEGDKAPEKKQKIKKTGKGKKRAQSPAVAKAESVEKDEEGEGTEEPLDEKPKDAQKAKDRALCVPVDEQFAARSNGKSS